MLFEGVDAVVAVGGVLGRARTRGISPGSLRWLWQEAGLTTPALHGGGTGGGKDWGGRVLTRMQEGLAWRGC